MGIRVEVEQPPSVKFLVLFPHLDERLSSLLTGPEARLMRQGLDPGGCTVAAGAQRLSGSTRSTACEMTPSPGCSLTSLALQD